MKENINTASILTIEQRQCLLHIWNNITYTLVLTGEATGLFQALNGAHSALSNDQATIERAQDRLRQLFSEVPVGAIGELQLSQLINQISTALTGTATNIEHNIPTGHSNVEYGLNTSLSDGRPQVTNIPLSNWMPKSNQSVHIRENIDGEGGTVRVSDPEDNDCVMEDSTVDERIKIPLDNVSQSSQLTPAERSTKSLVRTRRVGKSRRRTKRPPFPLSAKQDLTPADINPLTSFLIEDSTVTFFFDNHQSIYEAWITTSPRRFDVTMSIVATFDMVVSLVQNKKDNYLKLRFAYIHLMRAIEVLNAARKKDPLSSQARQETGYSINSAAVNIYLNAKKGGSYTIPSRSQLLEYIRIGRRWPKLAGPSPFQLAVYTRSAETIINNYSIREPSLKAIAAEVQHISPELIRLLVSFDENEQTNRSSSTYFELNSTVI